ncbi:chromate efflux transporter [Cellvibrio japonicus]|uniref:Chromate transporter n=1 Tax=Cellvibrio japonicus (strain Ueda107) TaxID=498211 RepID=B3PCJ0_CELJU|nr:chromate efflux transporter [Cellvibrio japonicus]ACE83028.1 chromate transporter [Cellvibrio japonicus Ueda107]QEI11892.1 chromate efflux transporter [Cellvibrio japonicus]QEI15466.1 chromate efflux transporter [Cellvibrio japonicus]QEI19045.1 chromate efflux transporter [Cellvibrio japonicus]
MSHDEKPLPTAPTLRDALGFWLKLGFISFGGPAGQIAILHQELVDKRRWISERRFLHALNYCMLLPGPEAQQLATYIGWLMHRTWGGIVAGALFVLPSLLILIVLSWVYMAYGDLPIVAGVFYGIKPAVTAIVVHAAYRIGSRTLNNAWLWSIAAGAFIAIFAIQVPFPAIVLGAALAGYIGGRLSPASFYPGSPHRTRHSTAATAAFIDDHTPTPLHARFRWQNLGVILLVGVLLWLIPMGLLSALLGWGHTLTQMGWFFTKAALFTFGGAYAVLPYVYQGAIGHYHWVTPTQMMDGLALGETTPGPLIMVVAFVGFIGAYTQAIFGPDQLFIAGAIAACLVTWFTFLPSFLFILAGGPLVESTHGQLNLVAPLTAITAAVVGVILNLALFFGYHLLWPQGFEGNIDRVSGLITLFAALLLFYFRRGVIEVILYCGLTGLATMLIPRQV